MRGPMINDGLPRVPMTDPQWPALRRKRQAAHQRPYILKHPRPKGPGWTPEKRAEAAERMRIRMSKPWGDNPDRREAARKRTSERMIAFWAMVRREQSVKNVPKA